MRKGLFCLLILGLLVATSGWSSTVTVNKAGTGGAYTSINAALAAGGTYITITDSSTYEEDLILGDNSTIAGGPAITITSDKTGEERPRLTPTVECPSYTDGQASRRHCVQVFSPNSHFSNLIFEANGDNGAGCMGIIAEGVVVENCLFHPKKDTINKVDSSYGFVHVGSQGTAGGAAEPGGRQSDNLIIRNCEFNGILPQNNPEPVNEGYQGYLAGGNCGQTQLVRMDVYSNDGVSGRIIDVTFESCLFHYSPDLHIFPSNRGDEAGGQLIVYLMNCRMDATAKFSIRGRGACVVADHTVFTRTNQGPHGDGENSAVAINTQQGHTDNWAKVTDCLFVNCGSPYSKKGYFGGVHNANTEGLMEVDHCTFDKCVNGVAAGCGGGGTENTRVKVTNSIFHRIGYQSEPAVDESGLPLSATTPYDIPAEKLYKAAWWGVKGVNAYFVGGGAIYSGVFNAFYLSSPCKIAVQDTLVGTIADEALDTRNWDAVLTEDSSLTNPEFWYASRLDCGNVGAEADDNITYLNPITRGTPVFKNTDPDAEIPYELDPSSPGQGWGARFGTTTPAAVRDWNLYN